MSYPVPYSAPCTLSDGKKIVLDLFVPSHAKRLNISFCQGRDYKTTTVLIFDVRFNDNCVVRNHFHGSWGSEERHGGIPLKKGEQNQVEFQVQGDVIKVLVNHNHFCDFKNRVGKELAQNIFIDGDVEIKKIDTGSSGSHGSSGHDHPPVPFCVPISIHEGKKISISGIPTGNNRFTINLGCGPNLDHNDSSFVFDIRFKFQNDHNVVIRNSKCGNWGSEERHQPCFPFVPNAPFNLVIKVKDECYKVTVNDEKFATYNFRDKRPEHVTHLCINGDVKLTHVKY